MARPALFLDRDGTLIEDVGDLGHPSQIVLIPGAIDALKALSRRFAFFIVTNQSGVSLGRLTLSQVHEVNNHLIEILSEHGISIEHVYICIHERKQNCDCIKPKPFFLHEARRDFDIDLTRSWSVGDHPHDATFAPAAGGKGVYVLTGHGRRHLCELPSGNTIIDSIAELPDVIDALP